MSTAHEAFAADGPLARRMAGLGLREADLDERFIRASGPGGQHTNKASTCVVLTHRLTGVVVRCEAQRSQRANRLVARHRLVEKLEALAAHRARARQAAIAKLRRQRRRRSAAVKERILQAKHHRASVKALRRTARSDE